MINKQKEKNIFTKLNSEFKNGTLNDFDIAYVLKRNSISEEDFYYFFPNKTKSLCNFFLSNLKIRLERKIKKKLKMKKALVRE